MYTMVSGTIQLRKTYTRRFLRYVPLPCHTFSNRRFQPVTLSSVSVPILYHVMQKKIYVYGHSTHYFFKSTCPNKCLLPCHGVECLSNFKIHVAHIVVGQTDG